MFYPYPSSPPTTEIIQLVIDAVQRRQVDYKEAAHAAWHIGGYGLSQWDVHPTPMFSGKLSDDAICEALESLKSDGTMKAIPWGILLPILFEFVIKWLQPKPA